MTRLSISICALLGIVLLSGVGCITDPPAGDNAGPGLDAGLNDAAADDASASDGSVSDGATDGMDSEVSPDGGSDMGVEPPPEFKRSSAGLLLYYRFLASAERIEDEGPGGRTTEIPMNAVLSPEGLTLPTSAFLTVPDSSGLEAELRTAGAFTIETWVTTTDDAFAPVFSFGQFTPAQVPANDQTLDAPICVIGCATADNQVRNALARGRATHLVITGEGNSLRVFVDGVLAGTWIVGDPTSIFEDAEPVLELGSFSIARTYGMFAIYNRALSPGEILSHNLVGPRPEPTDETNVELLALFPSISDDGLYRLSARRTTIIDGGDQSVLGSVIASEDQHGLYRQMIDIPPSGTHIYSRLDFRSMRNQLATSGVLEIWRMRRNWTLEANWADSGPEEWAAAGASGVMDRGRSPIQTIDVGTNDRAFGQVDVSDLVATVEADPRLNYGLQFTCDGCAVEVDGSSPMVRDISRLRIKSLWEQARSTTTLTAPTVESIQVENENRLSLEWMPQTEPVEIFIDGELVRKVSVGNMATVVLPVQPSNPLIQLRTADRWGRVSDLIAISNPT